MELTRLLTEFLSQGKPGPEKNGKERPWTRRRVLICSTEERREIIARRLDEHGYQVFVAADTRQAVERMRENQLEVVLLDPEFDAAEQGAAFVTREVNILRPAQRRRIFFGLLSTSLRTLDAHAAFLSNANLTVNVNDLEELPMVLDRSIRDYNDLYTDFFLALKVPAL
jgi:CheY-like chemotaxis protein